MGDAPEHLRIGTAAFEAAGPEPGLIAHHDRGAAFPGALHDQERIAVRRLQQGFPAQRGAMDMAQPAAPLRRVRTTVQPGRDRVAQAGIRRLRRETVLGDIAGRAHRQDGRQGRAVEARRPGKGRTRRHQERTAIFHIAGDIVEIERRHDIAPAIAVENDQIELAQALHEELLDREADQSQLVHRRRVTAVWRPQDGEVDQVDRRVGLQQVAPGAGAIVRLAGDQQHTQTVAHAIHIHRSAIVDQGEFLRTRLDLGLDDILAAALHRHFHTRGLADRDAVGLRISALEAEGDHGRAAHGIVLHADHELDRIADNAVARRFLDHQAAIPGRDIPGHDMVQRGIEIETVRIGRRIMHLAVRHHDDAGNPVRRGTGEGGIHPVEQHGAVGAFRGFHLDQVQQRIGFGFPAQGIAHRVRRLGAAANVHGGRPVGDKNGDIGQRISVFLHQGGIGEHQRDAGNGQAAPDPAGQALQGAGQGGQQGETRQPGNQLPGQEGRKIEGGHGRIHWPSLSRMSGTWTWSAL